MDERTDEWTDGRTDGRTDRAVLQSQPRDSLTQDKKNKRCSFALQLSGVDGFCAMNMKSRRTFFVFNEMKVIILFRDAVEIEPIVKHVSADQDNLECFILF